MTPPSRHKEFIDRLRGLSVVKRWNFHPSLTTENVAEHSYYVAMYAWLFASMDGHQYSVLGHIVMHALFHDVEESMTGDLPMLVKRMVMDQWRVVEWYGIDQLTETLPAHIKNAVYFNKYNKGGLDHELVNKYVKAGDIFDVLIYCRVEAKLGNTNYRQIERESVTRLREFDLPSISKILHEYGYGDLEVELPNNMAHL